MGARMARNAVSRFNLRISIGDPETLHKLVQRPIHSDGYAFQVELKWRAFTADVRIEEYPIVFTERIGGTSKMSRAIALEAAWIVPCVSMVSIATPKSVSNRYTPP